MILTGIATAVVAGTLGAGYTYEAIQVAHPKDAHVNYIYDPTYFELGDEHCCGDTDVCYPLDYPLDIP